MISILSWTKAQYVIYVTDPYGPDVQTTVNTCVTIGYFTIIVVYNNKFSTIRYLCAQMWSFLNGAIVCVMTQKENNTGSVFFCILLDFALVIFEATILIS